MAYKEIVTKAVIGKGKKRFKEKHTIENNLNINNVLGCWVINHSFQGRVNSSNINVSGSYDVNIWYSYNNNSKTNVMIKRFNYDNLMNVKIKENGSVNNNSEIIVRSLSQPTVTDVDVTNNEIVLSIEREMGVEVVGDAMVKVSVEESEDDYEEIIDDEDIEINEEYLD